MKCQILQPRRIAHADSRCSGCLSAADPQIRVARIPVALHKGTWPATPHSVRLRVLPGTTCWGPVIPQLSLAAKPFQPEICIRRQELRQRQGKCLPLPWLLGPYLNYLDLVHAFGQSLHHPSITCASSQAFVLRHSSYPYLTHLSPILHHSYLLALRTAIPVAVPNRLSTPAGSALPRSSLSLAKQREGLDRHPSNGVTYMGPMRLESSPPQLLFCLSFCLSPSCD